REVENEPAISLLVAQLPEVEIAPFTVTQHELEESSGPAFWHFQLEVTPDDNPNILLFADPFSIQSMQLVGASEELIQAPFVFEGMIQGVAASLVAVACLWSLFQFLRGQFAGSVGLFGAPAQLQFLELQSIVLLLIIGWLLGAAGSLFALRRFVKTWAS
ncbi:MAG: cell division protein, partial [Deltaproteobacteria bacterium]|nr:cell division protein [Deltaproteobacteria bacterium]